MKIKSMACLLVMAAFGVAGAAQADGQKLGYVDISEVLQATPTAKQASDAFNKQLDAEQKSLDGQREKIEQAQRDLEKQSALMSEEQKRNKERQIQGLISSLQKAQREAQDDLEKKKNALNQTLLDLQDDVFAAIEVLGREQGYALIVHDKSVAYVDESIDITKQVIAALAKAGQAKPAQEKAGKGKK